MRTACRSRSILYGPQFAGWDTHTEDGGPPSRVDTSVTTARNSWDIRASAEYGVPPSISGVVSPTPRLNSRATRFGSVRPRRLAASPVRKVSSERSSTTDGMAAPRPPRDAICARPSRQVAAAVYVVPRSMPSAYIAMLRKEVGQHAFARPDGHPRGDRQFVTGQRVLRAALPSGQGVGRAGGQFAGAGVRGQPQPLVHRPAGAADHALQLGDHVGLARHPPGPQAGQDPQLIERVGRRHHRLDLAGQWLAAG